MAIAGFLSSRFFVGGQHPGERKHMPLDLTIGNEYLLCNFAVLRFY